MARLWDWVDGIPDRSWGGGVYALYLGKELVYVGHTGSFYVRLTTHRRRIPFDAVKVAPMTDKRERQALERKLLFRLRPRYNRTLPSVYRPVGFLYGLVRA